MKTFFQYLIEREHKARLFGIGTGRTAYSSFAHKPAKPAKMFTGLTSTPIPVPRAKKNKFI